MTGPPGSSSAPRAAFPIPIPGPTSPQSAALGDAATGGQSYLLVPNFTLESGVELQNVPVAYKTWGKLSADGDNAMVVCHALTGSADIEDWWGPLLGPGRVFDPTRFLVVCLNVLGSPYGSASPCTRRGGEASSGEASRPVVQRDTDGKETVHWWGPEFPATSVRDDVRIHKLVLDYLGVTQVAAVVGGSMGGMAVLEWPLCFPVRYPTREPASVPEGAAASSDSANGKATAKPYIRAIVPIATAARHSAWCISWAEAQRQSIYSDPAYNHGYYMPSTPPRAGLSAARMAALLTYRSRDSFESRFGRRTGGPKKGNGKSAAAADIATLSVHDAAGLHNEGNSSPRTHAADKSSTSSIPTLSSIGAQMAAASVSESAASPSVLDPLAARDVLRGPSSSVNAPKVYSAQSYLRYQGDKFVKRFDANCYVHLTRKMDTHDVARGREHWEYVGRPAAAEAERNEDDEALARVLSHLSLTSSSTASPHGAPSPRVLVVSIQSDGLFMPTEQQLMHDLIDGSELVTIESPEGHDAFLIERYMLSYHVGTFLVKSLSDTRVGPNLYAGAGVGELEWSRWNGSVPPHEASDEKGPVKESVYGEVEDVTRW